MDNYLIVLVFFIFGILLAYGVLVLSYFFGPKRKFIEKLEPYESGVKPGKWGRHINIHYYLVGLAFLIFDIEVIFLFPWVLNIEKFKMIAFVEAFIFIVILFLGYVYMFSKGGFEWK
ncbi:MAG: NADH-quinone oxidoreductase subunit A [candidate division WOR-3 bacterium]|nr:NADH-quinone oxidoreductase subunit A [candidate division WOR-3 bacterium]MCX7947769.1 NADH-quinone oxidoreductase subunit A [candidate division WOR-3 bacterium]MDW8150307.1 NADH-quinone oxidoreductase subunit A [candidate division WOR-3 bacterium]